MEDKSNTKDKGNKEEGNKVCNKELDRYERIVNRAHEEIAGVRHVYMWLASVLGIIVVAGMLIATFITYSTIGEITSRVEERVSKFEKQVEERIEERVSKLEKRVEERIEEQFDKDKVTTLVENKAIERIDNVADKLIGEKIDEKVNPLISDVGIKVGDLQSQLVMIDEKVNRILADSEKKLRVLEAETEKNLKAMQIESEFLLTVLRAQNGDKESWLKLGQIAEKEQGTEQGRFAVNAFKRTHDNFFRTAFVDHRYYLPKISDSEVVEKLKSDWPHERKMAVYTMKVRSMYDQIPVLISMIHREDNLDVLGEIYRVLNDLLETDIEMQMEIGKDALGFERAWETKKKQLEETKGDKK